jgi:hypothetical protein
LRTCLLFFLPFFLSSFFHFATLMTEASFYLTPPSICTFCCCCSWPSDAWSAGPRRPRRQTTVFRCKKNTLTFCQSFNCISPPSLGNTSSTFSLSSLATLSSKGVKGAPRQAGRQQRASFSFGQPAISIPRTG